MATDTDQALLARDWQAADYPDLVIAIHATSDPVVRQQLHEKALALMHDTQRGE